MSEEATTNEIAAESEETVAEAPEDAAPRTESVFGQIVDTSDGKDAAPGGVGLSLADAIAKVAKEEERESRSQVTEQESVLGSEKEKSEPEDTEEADKAAEEEARKQNQLNPNLSDEQKAFPWFVVNTYSGYELYAKKSLLERIKSRGIEEQYGNVLVPQETVVELVRGKKKTSTRKFFPGYMLVQMDLNDETWHIVSGTPKVTGFVGDSRHPSPIDPAEVEALTQQMAGAQARPRPRVSFEQGDTIKVIDGPFKEFNGTVDEVKPEKGKLRVLISIFGRNTPVELDFVQVEKS